MFLLGISRDIYALILIRVFRSLQGRSSGGMSYKLPTAVIISLTECEYLTLADLGGA